MIGSYCAGEGLWGKDPAGLESGQGSSTLGGQRQEPKGHWDGPDKEWAESTGSPFVPWSVSTEPGRR